MLSGGGVALLAAAGLVGTPVSALAAAQITEYPIPTANSGPHGITVAPDGSVWFTEIEAGKIGRLRGA